MEVYQAIQLMFGFGSFLIALLTFVLVLIKHDKDQKNNRLPLTGAVIF